MKKTVILSAAILLGISAFADSKIDLGSQARLRATMSAVASTAPAKKLAKNSAQLGIDAPMQGNRVRGFVTLTPGADVSELEAIDGLTITRRRGNIALVEIAADAIDAIENSRAVSRFTAERIITPKLDLARKAVGVDMIHSGEGLSQPYTGKGVIAGIVDGGFDPNHINFKNTDGTSRIAHFTYYRPTQSGDYVEEKYGADYIPNIDTENSTTFHGTHTTGIMAGGYRGKVSAAKLTPMSPTTGRGLIQEIDNPYYGIAYDADIAASAGALTDYYIAMGVESILDYAWESGRPSVINLSLGSNVGPHDGSSTICQYLDMAAENDPVIFCVSAGNEGDYPIALHKTFTATDNTVASILLPVVPMTNYQNVHFGQTYIYSNDATQFEVQAIIINKSRNKVAMRMPLEATDGAMKYWVSSAEYQGDSSDIVSDQFARYLTGYVGVGAEFDATTGRYYAVIDCMTWDNTAGNNADGNYLLGFQVTGSDGQRVDIFNDGVYNQLDSYGLEGYADGMTDGTISDVACGHNYVVVGSYNTRDAWASMDGYVYGYDGTFESGKISGFSSWGTLYDGRQLPTVCAPGATIISSSNEYYLDAYKIGKAEVQATATDDSRNYSWHQCVGTSMATPVVTGSIALWLEADPTLDYRQVLDIIRRTATVDADVTSAEYPVQWGAGKFNAYEGLKEVLKNASVTSVKADGDTTMIRNLGGNSYEVFSVAADFDVNVYTLAGATTASFKANGNTAQIDLSTLAPGVYIVNVNGYHNEKILVK